MKPHTFRLAAPALLALLTIAAPGHSQDAVPEAAEADGAEIRQAHMRAFSQGDYVGAYLAFGGLDPSEMDPMTRSTYAQFVPSLSGFVPDVSDHGHAHEVDDALAKYDGAEVRDAVATIVERARDTRIVIVNETHDNPRDRAFVLAVAEALRPLGYTHYAAETLQNCCAPEEAAKRMDELEQRGYPVFLDGYYTSEPMFGFLVRRVLELGYRPVPYEWTPGPTGVPSDRNETIRLRETAQAENIARAIAAADPDARFLIHVGYSHATEKPLASGQEWMASRLKRMTGIDPLTIDQADLSQYSQPELHSALAARVGQKPVIFLSGGETVRSGPNAQAMDLQVVHPPIAGLGGRPDWLARTGRRGVPVPQEMMPKQGRRLIQVFATGDGQDAVPVDQMLIEAGDQAPLLYVPEGEYRWSQHDL